LDVLIPKAAPEMKSKNHNENPYFVVDKLAANNALKGIPKITRTKGLLITKPRSLEKRRRYAKKAPPTTISGIRCFIFYTRCAVQFLGSESYHGQDNF
jgi:hypothetical protein